MNKVPRIHKRMIKIVAVPSPDKKDPVVLPMGEPSVAAANIISIVYFLMQRVPQAQQQDYMINLRGKIWNMNELEISNKNVSSGSAIGQAITFVKNVLMGHNPSYVREVLKQVAIQM